MLRNQLCSNRSFSQVSRMLVVACAALAATPAGAAEPVSAAEIAEAVSDRTFQGSMLQDAFAEYYAADGTIKGKDYVGKWRTKEGAMCFIYGDNPEKCWGLEINGPAVILYKDGEVDGTGILIQGNKHDF